jgi:hypothetical protein
MKVMHKEGQDRIPHLEFWKDLPTLVIEGCKYTQRKVQDLINSGQASETVEEL